MSNTLSLPLVLAIVFWVISPFDVESLLTGPDWLFVDQWGGYECALRSDTSPVALRWTVPTFMGREGALPTVAAWTGTKRDYVRSTIRVKGKPERKGPMQLKCNIGGNEMKLDIVIRAYTTNPVLKGPQSLPWGVEGVWTCTSTEAYPRQTIEWYVDTWRLESGFVTETTERLDKAFDAKSVLRYTPSSTNDSFKLVCAAGQSTMGDVRTTMVVTRETNPHVRPSKPVIVGPSTAMSGQTAEWVCSSGGGYPRQQLLWYVNGEQENLNINSSFVHHKNNTYDVKSYLSIKPVPPTKQLLLRCDVTQESWDQVLSTTHVTRILYLKVETDTEDVVFGTLLASVVVAVVVIISICCFAFFVAGKRRERRHSQASRRSTALSVELAAAKRSIALSAELAAAKRSTALSAELAAAKACEWEQNKEARRSGSLSRKGGIERQEDTCTQPQGELPSGEQPEDHQYQEGVVLPSTVQGNLGKSTEGGTEIKDTDEEIEETVDDKVHQTQPELQSQPVPSPGTQESNPDVSP